MANNNLGAASSPTAAHTRVALLASLTRLTACERLVRAHTLNGQCERAEATSTRARVNAHSGPRAHNAQLTSAQPQATLMAIL